MADYLLGLTQRALGVANTLQPLIPSIFEPGMQLPSDLAWDWQAEPTATEMSAPAIETPLPPQPLTSQPGLSIAASSSAAPGSSPSQPASEPAFASAVKKKVLLNPDRHLPLNPLS